MRERFSIYRSVFNALRVLPAEELKKAFVMIGRYALDDELPEDQESVAYAILLSVKPLIDTSARRADAGRMGGESKLEANCKQNEANCKQNEANSKQSEANCKQSASKVEANGSKVQPKIKDKRINIKDKRENNIKEKGEKVEDNVFGDKSPVRRFMPPTLEEVKEYITEHGYKVDAERFVDFYESKGWMVGKNKMKDWKAAVRTWNRSQRQESTANVTQRQEMTAKPKTNRFNNFDQRDYNFSDLERRLLGGGV